MMRTKRIGLLAGVACLAIGFSQASAVVITAGDGSGNTTASGNFASAFAHVGTGGAGAIAYLGNGVILTANHVFNANPSGNVKINGTNYPLIANSSHQLHAPGDPGNLDDLRLLQIDITGGNPGGLLPLGTATTGSTVRMVGNGFNRDTAQTTWYVDTTPVTWVWSTSPFVGWDATGTGYRTSLSSQSLRWGENKIDGTPVAPAENGVNVVNMATVFTDPTLGGFADEAQAVEHDSGGSVFQFNSIANQWELVGIITNVGPFIGQPNTPGHTDTAVFGNATYFADLSKYQDQISAYMASVPEPASASVLMIVGAMLLGHRRRLAR